MSTHRFALLAMALAAMTLAGCSETAAPTTSGSGTARDNSAPNSAPSASDKGASSASMPVAASVKTPFVAPQFADIPDDDFGKMVRLGRDIFVDTQAHAGKYVGNGLNCGNCHLDAGRLADSAPLWGAIGRYPAFRKKNDMVNTYAERLQGCFEYSMDGTAPPADGDVIKALTAYSFWLAKGVPIGVDMPGAGFRKDFKAPQPPDYARGEKVFQASCAICHGSDGQGQKVAGRYVFPPLWGGDSFNWGAGMHNVDTAAAFIKYNMPLGRGGTLTDQDAWDVAQFMDSHERPQDPRFTGDVAATDKKFHGNPTSMYGVEVNGKVLGAHPSE